MLTVSLISIVFYIIIVQILLIKVIYNFIHSIELSEELALRHAQAPPQLQKVVDIIFNESVIAGQTLELTVQILFTKAKQ